MTMIFDAILILGSLKERRSTNTTIITRSKSPVKSLPEKNDRSSVQILQKPVFSLLKTKYLFTAYANKTEIIHEITVAEVTFVFKVFLKTK